MHRLTVALLAAFDAIIAAAVGLVFAFAPLLLLWAVALGAGWSGLWPTTATIWQLGHFVPVTVSLPETLLTATGISHDAAQFTLSLAPLGFAAFTAVFAARSGWRAADAGAWLTGVLTGTVVFAAVTVLVWLTSGSDIHTVVAWQAIPFPPLVYLLPALVGALVFAWVHGDDGWIDRLHSLWDQRSVWWRSVPNLAGRGIAMVLVSLIALGALAVAVAVVVRGGDVIALYQSTRVDLLGAVLLTLAHLAYLPTLIVWAVSWLAGPGFVVGAGASVTPAATHLGIVPGLPLFGLLPETNSPWVLAVVLLPIGAGAFAGWVLRSRYLAAVGPREPVLPRIVLVAVVAIVPAAVAALCAALASGSIGPGRLTELGPNPGQVALALAVEVGLGAAILLLSPRSAHDDAVTRGADTEVRAASPTAQAADRDAYGGDRAAYAADPDLSHADPDANATVELMIDDRDRWADTAPID